MSELTKSSKIVVDFELSKIIAIEEFLLMRNVPKHFVTNYACAIYNQRREDITVTECDDDD